MVSRLRGRDTRVRRAVQVRVRARGSPWLAAGLIHVRQALLVELRARKLQGDGGTEYRLGSCLRLLRYSSADSRDGEIGMGTHALSASSNITAELRAIA